MYEIPEDYVITYDCNFIQEHIDSSDFEESCTPLVDTRKGNHNLINPKRKMKPKNYSRLYLNNNNNNANNDLLYIDCDEYPVKLKEENNTFKQKETKYKYGQKRGRKHKTNINDTINLNRGDQVEPAKSKLSIIKHKVIPCISSIFKRTNSTKHNMSVIKENQNENTRADNCCQYCNNCEQRRIRKLCKKQQNYVVQPVYTIEGNAHKTAAGPFAPTKIKAEPLQHHNCKTKNQYSSYCSLSSSSESDTQCTRERQQKVETFRKRLKTEIMKEHMKYQQNQPIRTQQMQYPSKENKYQVFTTPMQSITHPQIYDGRFINKIPSSASSFWEYLYDKTTACGKKYQTQRLEMPCTCLATQQIQCGHSTCCIKRNQPDLDMESYADMSEKSRQPACLCKPQQQHLLQQQPQQQLQQQQQQHQQNNPYCIQKKSCDPLCTPPKRCDPKCSADTMVRPSHMDLPSMALPPKSKDSKNKQKNKVQCQCPEKSKLQQGRKGSKDSQDRGAQKLQGPKRSDNQATSGKPCQEGHDEIVSSLAQKYNGEVLCIHNPPCILINGCLNLPPQKDQQQNNEMSFWPVTGSTKHNFYNQARIMNREQSCQYHIEVNHATDYRAEKNIQSICHHNPPCEVVRGCYKAKYDPNLENSCVHVPMCKQMPECVVVDKRRKCCEHRPKCRDIPICSRDFVILTARENIGTQVKTSVMSEEKETYVCRHEPPCIMIPKCIGKVCDSSYVNVDAIPGCSHQPSCDLIPACCRKSAKEMVSVSSQYPNSCRIV